MIMRKFIWLNLAILLLSACNPFNSLQLQQDDIDRYITAYRNIAAVSPQLKKQRKVENAVSVLTCEECRDILRNAVRKAGYDGISDFLLADARISITLQYALQAKIAAEIGDVAGEVYSEVPLEIACASVMQSKKPEDQKLKRYCHFASALGVYVDQLGNTVRDAAKKLMQLADFELLLRNFEPLFSAVTDPSLIDEFNHSGGGDWDD